MPIASAIDIFNFTIKLYPHQIRARQATEQKKLVFDKVFEKASNPRGPESQGYPPGNHVGYLVYLFTLRAPGQLRVRLQARAAEPTRAFSWLKATTSAFTFKTLLRHYAKRVLTPRSLNVKLGHTQRS